MQLPRLSPGAERTAATAARAREGHAASLGPVCNGTCSSSSGDCGVGCVCGCTGNVCACVPSDFFPSYRR